MIEQTCSFQRYLRRVNDAIVARRGGGGCSGEGGSIRFGGTRPPWKSDTATKQKENE